VKITAVAAGLAFPHAAQAIQIVRRRRPLNSKKWSSETVYAITSLTAIQAQPAGLAAIIRGHWLIEDRLHWIRDMDWDEDRSQVRTANGRRVMASLRNLAITILRLTGETSIAAALRHHARRPGRPLQTIMNCQCPESSITLQVVGLTHAESKLVPLLLTGSGARHGRPPASRVEVLVTRILAEKGRGQDTHGPTPGEPGLWFRRGGRRDRSLC
jgi:hypothetical protein